MSYYSVSDAIAEIMEEMAYVKAGMRHELINYSALARMIKPLVDKKVNSEVSLETIILALKRNSESYTADEWSKQLYACAAEGKISLSGDMTCVHFKRTKDLFKKIVEIEFTLDYSVGERMYVIQRTDEISVIASTNYLPNLLELVKEDPSQLLEKRENLAMITITMPYAGVYTPGLLHYYASQFAKLGVNLFGSFFSFSKLSFAIDEKEASMMFQALTKSTKDAESIAEIL